MSLSRRTGARFQAAIWPGFVDAMTGLLLVLTFVLSIFMVIQFVLSETITGQEDELDVLSSEIAALAQALGVEERRNDQLNTQLGALQNTLSNSRDQIALQASQIAALQSQTQEQSAQIASFEQQVASLIAERDGVIAQVQDLGAQREALQRLVAEFEAKNADLTDRLNAEEAGRLAEVALAQELRARLEQSDAELTALSLALEDERRKAEETLTLLAAAREAEQDLNARLAAALVSESDLNSQLAQNIQEAEAEAQALQNQIAVLQGQLAAAQAALTDARSQGAVRDDRLAQARQALTEAQEKQQVLEGQIANLRADKVQLETDLSAAQQATGQTQSQLSDLSQKLARALADLAQGEGVKTELAATQARNAELAASLAQSQAQLDAQSGALSQAETDAAARVALEQQVAQRQQSLTGARDRITQLEAMVAQLQTDLQAARSGEEDLRSLEEKLATALADRMASEATVAQTREKLAAALAAKKAAELEAKDQLSASEAQQALLSDARARLAQSQEQATTSAKQAELLNQQVAQLRMQLGQLQTLLDDSNARDSAQQVQIQKLGSELNAAIARVAQEERRRRKLEQERAQRLEEEKRQLESYRSEFFGRLREVLADQEGIRIEGDRFVFSSEVLFQAGSADLSPLGRREIAKVSNILRQIMRDIPSEIDWIIRVDGHTDDVPIRRAGGQFQDNWHLSQARALSVVRDMIDSYGIPPQRLSANGFGQYQPINPAQTQEARAQNRRIELKLTER